MEYIEGFSLLEYLNKKPLIRITEEEAREIFSQLIDEINYLHSKKIYHRDIN